MSSITQDQLNDAVHTIKPTKQVKNDSVGIVRFDKYGKSDEGQKKKLNDNVTCASMTSSGTNGRNRIYRIKSQRGGKFYNPLKDGQHYGLDLQDRTSNDSMFVLREVNENAFRNYIKFLQTRYDSYLSAAERV